VLVDMAAKLGLPFRVFSLDTGAFTRDLQFLEKVRPTTRSPSRPLPTAEAVQTLVREKGLFSFYVDGHKECCGIRKVEPLVRALAPLRGWVTGQRKDQSPAPVPTFRSFSSTARSAHRTGPC